MTISIDPEYQEILAAWERAPMIKGVNPDQFRTDHFGRVIKKDHYDMRTEFGWHAVMIDPATKKNGNTPRLEAVQWQPFPQSRLKAV